MRRSLVVVLLAVLGCFCISLFTGWHDDSSLRHNARRKAIEDSISRKETISPVKVITSKQPYPLPYEGMTSHSSLSWNKARHDVNDLKGTNTDSKLIKLTEAWKVPSLAGHSSPVVIRDNVLLMSGGPSGVELSAYELGSGELAWTKTLSDTPATAKHGKGSAVSSTPVVVADGLIVCWSDSSDVWMARVQSDSSERWRYCVGPTNSQWGFNASPVAFRGLVYVNVDNQEAGCIVAINVNTGELVWKQSRPDGLEGSYSSPLVVADESGSAVVILSGLQRVVAFDGASGDLGWSLPAVSDVSAATPVFQDGFLVAASGHSRHHLIAMEFKRGIHLEPKALWAATRPSEVPYVPTPILRDDRLYLVQDDGIAIAIDIRSGKPSWKKRLGFAVTASPTWLKGTILACGESGQCSTLNPENGNTLSEIDLHEPIFASPTVLGSRLLVRTRERLHCFDIETSTAP